MGTSVRTKALKKQPPFTPAADDAAHTRRLEQAALELEDAVFHVLEADRGHRFMDVDFLYWHRRLHSTAMQISMALTECRGPQRFHYHYRHDPKNHDTLMPVAGPAPLHNLARVCREALSQCSEMVGVQDASIRASRNRLEQALRGFLHKCQEGARGN